MNVYSKKQKKRKSLGFTLIELLVVISVVGLLASSILVSLKQARTRARDAARLSATRQLRSALELYYNDNNGYPTRDVQAPGDFEIYSECDFRDNYIPNLVPKYIPKLPVDPALACPGVTHGWTYASDGRDFKLITHGEKSYDNEASIIDPFWDGGEDHCVIELGHNPVHYGFWSAGAICWGI